MAGTLQNLSIISFVIAGVCLLIAILLWFYFKIPDVIGDLTGRTARKSIAKMRTSNEKTKAKLYVGNKENKQRSKSTQLGSDNNKQDKPNNGDAGYYPETQMLQENMSEESPFAKTETLINESDETTSLVTSILYEGTKLNQNIIMLDEVLIVHTEDIIK